MHELSITWDGDASKVSRCSDSAHFPSPSCCFGFWRWGVEKREPDVAHCAGVSARGRESWCFRLFCLVWRVEGRGWVRGVRWGQTTLDRRVNGPHQRPARFPDWFIGGAEGLTQHLVPRSALPDPGGSWKVGAPTRIYLGWSEISSAHKCGLRSAEISQKGNLLTNLQTFQSQEKKCGKKKVRGQKEKKPGAAM